MGHFQAMNEAIRVVADFDGEKVRPLAFLLNGRKYVIARVNLVAENGSGPTKRFFFSVSDAANNFTLQYDPFRLAWTLTELYRDG